MALASYDDIKTSIQNWMFDRPDLANACPDFVTMFEGDMNRTLRTRHQLTTVTLTPDVNGNVALPDDYLEFRQVTALTNPRRPLSLVAPSYMDAKEPYHASGLPNFFTINGLTLTVLPLTTSDIQFIYYAKIPALSDTMTTNWLLDRYPNLYLAGSLKYAAMYIGEPERMQTMGAAFSGMLQAFMNDEKKALYSRASMRVSGPTP
ncbi:hypothetical protein LJR231_003464 [Phyllobacterium sp. LjRoot231]|uniref:phage adaptor protein n=1 Tax=Phyllobacterium sp. LjRoot231 TaxID=3342289 RepID=UPI003ECF9F11